MPTATIMLDANLKDRLEDLASQTGVRFFRLARTRRFSRFKTLTGLNRVTGRKTCFGESRRNGGLVVTFDRA